VAFRPWLRWANESIWDDVLAVVITLRGWAMTVPEFCGCFEIMKGVISYCHTSSVLSILCRLVISYEFI
jgi:hypothetical protein